MSKCSKNSCNTKGNVFLAKVESVFSNNECPTAVDVEYDTPFYDSTLNNKFITIPANGDEFIIHVPSTDRWTAGQWIHIEMIGKFPITSIINDTQLVLTNRSSIEPGKQYAGARKIWIAEPDLITESEGAALALQETLASEDFNFCAYTKQSSTTENGNPIAAVVDSALCQPCNNGTVEVDAVKCFRYYKNIVFKWFTIALPELTRTALSVVTFKRDGADITSPLQDLLWHPQFGDLYRRDMPATNAVDSYTQNGKDYVLVPSDYAANFYVLGPNSTTGKPEWRNFNEPVAKFIGTSMAAGSVNIKTIVESALGISLPASGEIQVSIWGQITVTGSASLALASATADGEIIASVQNYDNIGTGTRTITIDLASPTIVLAGVTSDFNLQMAYIPASMLLN